jgi:glycosyltransferase 2 family protein
MTRWRWLVGAVILAGLGWRTGSGPFLTGVRALDVGTLALGAGIAAVTTTAGAWRWHLVARELDVAIPLPAAVAACYRSQLLNSVLPGGVLGDVHRAVAHGRPTGATGRAVRAVVWERSAGQVVQLVLGAVVLLLLPSPVPAAVPWTLVVAVPVVLAVALATGRAPQVLGRRTRYGVVATSVVATAGYVATCVVAARAVGITAPVSTLLPLVVVVLVAAGLPVNLAGWGPREGMAAWVFAAAGLGADQGLAMAVAFGAMVLVASSPGLVLLVLPRRPARSGESPTVASRPVVRRPELAGGAAHA